MLHEPSITKPTRPEAKPVMSEFSATTLGLGATW
jgi:hypothetical protein